MWLSGFLADAEGTTQWVTRNLARLASRSLRNSALSSRGTTVTSDAGRPSRALDGRLGLSTLLERHLTDPLTGHHGHFALPDLFRQSICNGLAASEDTNEAERVAENPTLRRQLDRRRRRYL